MKMTLKVLLAFFLLLGVFSLQPTSSYAYWRGGHVWIGVGGPYYGYPYYSPYYDPYYYPYSYPSYVEASASYEPVVINGATYYLNNGVYYVYTQYGYQAVATPSGAPAPVIASTPVVAAAPVTVSADTDDSFTVNVPNDKGAYTAVLIKKSGAGYIGPQGEFYSDFPKISQLKAMYGK